MAVARYSFVVGASAEFGLQAYLLARSLVELAGVEPDSISAHLVPGGEGAVSDALLGLGVRVSRVEPFAGHPYCNKLQQLPALAGAEFDHVILLDTDMFAVRALAKPPDNAVRGKPVDLANPPVEVLARIFGTAGIELETMPVDVAPGVTARANFNGGLYVIPRSHLASLADRWLAWARWSLDNIALYERWTDHVDQVSFALAVAELGLPSEALPRHLNVPTHLGPLELDEPPVLLHYHRHLEDDLLLARSGDAAIDAAVDVANTAIAGWKVAQTRPRLYWPARSALTPPTGHPRDLRADTLERALGPAPDPATLHECVSLSRSELGFFPDHLPRCIEYPWVLRELRSIGKPAMRVLDVGAGVNVLPLILADAGHSVTTVDNHDQRREPGDRHSWTEWGYLDYANLRPGIASHQQDFLAYGPSERFDVIYSVSVVEHLPADARRAWLRRMATLLAPGGELLLTVDLVPRSRQLWRLSAGREVESVPLHGTLDDVCDELGRVGFVITQTIVHDTLPESRVGVALLRARRVEQPATTVKPAVGAGDTLQLEQPAVAVVVPAYRPGGRFIGLLESMAAQTYANVVVRVSLDHAPDHVMPVLPDMAGKRLEIVQQPRRLGWVGNTNAGLASVREPFFLMIGHDDQLSPTYIEAAMASLAANPAAMAAHGSVRYHGVRGGEMATSASIVGTREERVARAFEIQPHRAAFAQRGVMRSYLLERGLRLRTHSSDGQFSNDLMGLEVLLYGDTLSVPDIFYDKHTESGGLSRVLHARTYDSKSAMLADNLACLLDVLSDAQIPEPERLPIIARYAEWLLSLQGNWNVVSDAPRSDAEPYSAVRPALARFVAYTAMSVAGLPLPPPEQRSETGTAAAGPVRSAPPRRPDRPSRPVSARPNRRRSLALAVQRLPHPFRRNPLFDASWYLDQYPDVAGSRLGAYWHYWRHGIGEGRDPNAYFDTDWYLRRYPDVRESGMDPLDHYLRFGAAEGRDPGPRFQTRWYLNQNPDVAAAGLNPLLHFLRYGRTEGRAPSSRP
jgi:glycosyltransferase involved in cell wall biosynthesis/protein-L-isoaspartate O-methyltransferase